MSKAGEATLKLVGKFPENFDLQLYDTLTKKGSWFRVTAIEEKHFTLSPVFEFHVTTDRKKVVKVAIADYMFGLSGYKKRDLPPVNVYHVEPEPKGETPAAMEAVPEPVEEMFTPPAPEVAGIMPKAVWLRERQKEIAQALSRYAAAGKEIPWEWIDEYNELARSG